jgi:hypothetical protein
MYLLNLVPAMEEAVDGHENRWSTTNRELQYTVEVTQMTTPHICTVKRTTEDFYCWQMTGFKFLMLETMDCNLLALIIESKRLKCPCSLIV